MKKTLTALTAILLCSPILTNAAEDSATKTQAEQNPKIEELNQSIANISKDLKHNDQAHFFLIYNNHNIIATVKTVKKDVENAVQACSDNNPDMKDDLHKRFSQWDNAVTPEIAKAQAFRDNMIIAQNYQEAGEIRRTLELADNLRKDTEAKFEKIPVTSQEACEYLLNKMDETQDNMVSLMRSTLVNLPQTLQNLDEIEKDNQ